LEAGAELVPRPPLGSLGAMDRRDTPRARVDVAPELALERDDDAPAAAPKSGLRGPRWVGPALVLSFALNVLALFTPFLELHKTFSGRSIYSLPRSVELMWEAELYAIAILVVAFSIVFPFAKLYVLWRVWRGHLDETRARWRLAFVERFGKWSMLDVFIVCLLLSLTDHQFFIDSRPLVGLPCFLFAIQLSMVCGEVLEGRMKSEPIPTTRGRRWAAPLAAIAHVLAVSTPFLVVDSLLLSSNRVSVLGMAQSLAGLGWASWAAAFSVVAFVVVAPLLWLWARAFGASTWTPRIARWSMLDVFLFALVVFLIEGDAFVPTKLQSGAYLLATTIALLVVLRRA
jgi:paraquat-inducible protein A